MMGCQAEDKSAGTTATPAATTTPLPSAVALKPVDLASMSLRDLYSSQDCYLADITTGEVFSVNVPGIDPENPWSICPSRGLPDGRPLIAVGDVVYILDLENGGKLTPLATGEAAQVFSVSPSGRFISAEIGDVENRSHVVISVEEQREIMRISGRPHSLLWEPNEKHVLYTVWHPETSSSETVAASIENPTETTSIKDALFATWRKDGEILVFAKSEGYAWESIDINTGERTVLYRWPEGIDGENLSVRSVSHDGRYAAMAYWRSDGEGANAGRSVFVVPLDGGTGIEITGTQAVEWSPVENVLLVIANECSQPDLMLVELDGRIRTDFGPPSPVWEAHWSQDGTMVEYETQETPSESELARPGTRIVGVEDDQIHLLKYLPGFFMARWWSPDGRWLSGFVPHKGGPCGDTSTREMTEIRPFP